jgi:hypothetical protein
VSRQHGSPQAQDVKSPHPQSARLGLAFVGTGAVGLPAVQTIEVAAHGVP